MANPELAGLAPRRRSQKPARAISRRVVRGTRVAMRPSDPPTDEIPVWTSSDGIEVATARGVIDLAARFGVAMLATGSTAGPVVRTILKITRAYGLDSVHVDQTYTSIFISYHRGPDADPVTIVRVVPRRAGDVTRLARLREFAAEVVADPMPVDEARVRINSIITAPHTYRRWVVVAADMCLAASVALLIGGGWLVIALSMLSAFIIARLRLVLGHLGVATFFVQVVAASVPATLAALAALAASSGVAFAESAVPSLVVAAGIVVLFSSLSVVGAAEDAIEGFYLTATARSFEALTLSLGIVMGITTVLSISNRLGLHISINSQTTLEPDRLFQVGCAALISGFFAVGAFASGRAAIFAGSLGAGVWLGAALLRDQGFGAVTAASVAAVGAGFIARALGRRIEVAPVAVTTAAIIPLLPGRAVYQGITEIVSNPNLGLGTGLATLAGAAGIGLGLAAGVSLGTYFASILSVWRRGGRLLRPPPAGKVR